MDYFGGGNRVSRPADWEDGFCAEHGEFGQKHRHIFAYLAMTEYQGKPRATGKLSIWVEDGVANVCLTDRETKRVTFGVGPNVELALEALEAALEKHQASWRNARGGPVY